MARDFLELLAGVEARQQVGHLACGHLIQLIRAIGAVAQPEAAEIAQLDDVAVGQFLRDDLQKGFQHGHGVRAADGAHLRDALGQLAQALAAAGLDGGVELLGRFPVLRVGPFYDFILYTHGLVPSYFLVCLERSAEHFPKCADFIASRSGGQLSGYTTLIGIRPDS